MVKTFAQKTRKCGPVSRIQKDLLKQREDLFISISDRYSLCGSVAGLPFFIILLCLRYETVPAVCFVEAYVMSLDHAVEGLAIDSQHPRCRLFVACRVG